MAESFMWLTLVAAFLAALLIGWVVVKLVRGIWAVITWNAEQRRLNSGDRNRRL